MKFLLVEDDKILRNQIKYELEKKFKTEIIETGSGLKAVKLSKDKEIEIVLLDWELPDLDGIKVLSLLRNMKRDSYLYIIMLTGRNKKEDLVLGLNKGADDYIKKPFDFEELFSRINVGKRTISLITKLKEKVTELENSSREIKTLKGLLPICSYCKSIRIDENYWQKLENYLSQNTDLKLSHGICPECYSKYISPQIIEQKSKKFVKII